MGEQVTAELRMPDRRALAAVCRKDTQSQPEELGLAERPAFALSQQPFVHAAIIRVSSTGATAARTARGTGAPVAAGSWVTGQPRRTDGNPAECSVRRCASIAPLGTWARIFERVSKLEDGVFCGPSESA